MNRPARLHTIGRDIVLGTLGVGGMGLVVAVYDPELDRKVALKLLRPRLDGQAIAAPAELVGGGPTSSAPLLRGHVPGVPRTAPTRVS